MASYYDGSKVKYERLKRGMTQRQFAELVGIAPGSLNKIEQCKVLPRPATMVKISKALGVHITGFITHETNSKA